MQLVARVPAPLFYRSLSQLANASTDDIALGVAVECEWEEYKVKGEDQNQHGESS